MDHQIIDRCNNFSHLLSSVSEEDENKQGYDDANDSDDQNDPQS